MKRRYMQIACALVATAAFGAALAVPLAPAQSESGETSNDSIMQRFDVRPNSTAEGARTLTAGHKPQPLTLPELRQLKILSSQKSLDLDQLMRLQVGVEEFSQLTTALQEKWPDSFVRAGVPRLGVMDRFWIQWKGYPDGDAMKYLSDLPVDVELQYGAPASSAELADFSEVLVTTLQKDREVIEESGTRYDPLTQVLNVEYLPAEGASDEAVSKTLSDALEAGAGGDGSRASLPLPVSLQENPELEGGHFTAIFAGGRDVVTTTYAKVCTFAFTAVRSGVDGLLTARHCPNTVYYNENENTLGSAVEAAAPYDVQFHPALAGHSTSKQFRAYNRTQTGDEVVTGVADAPYLAYVCSWGQKTSATRCEYVTAQNECRSFGADGTACGVDGLGSVINQGGDSGGPVFNGGSARGSLTGNTNNQTWFTRVSAISGQLGAASKQK